MDVFQNMVIFIFGAMMGSAANALIDRLPKSESWFKGRSHCDKCRHLLGLRDLIPVASYLSLGGKCRYCHSPIPVRNFWVEMFLGLSFMVINGHVWSANSLLLSLIMWVTVIIAVMDWETKLVSETMVGVWGLLVVSYGFLVMRLGWGNLAGIVAGVGVIGGIWAISHGKAMGEGDVEIAAVLGWWLGWPVVAPALWMAFVTGAIVGGCELLVGKKKLKSEIAFGPFLIFGGWAAYFWGEKIIRMFF